MHVKTCNKCKKPIGMANYFDFDINQYNSYGAGVSNFADYDAPEVDLSDFQLCHFCMKDFVKFIKGE